MNVGDLYQALNLCPAADNSDTRVFVEIGGKWLEIIGAGESLSHRVPGVVGPVFLLHAREVQRDTSSDLRVYKHQRGWAVARRGTTRARFIFRTKAKAITCARQLAYAENRRSRKMPRIYIHGGDGRVVEAVIAQ